MKSWLFEHMMEGGDIPILMLTANRAFSAKRTGFATGIDNYLTKPFDSDSSEDTIKTHISRLRRRMIAQTVGIVIGAFCMFGLVDHFTHTMMPSRRGVAYDPLDGIGMIVPMALIVVFMFRRSLRGFDRYFSRLSEAIGGFARLLQEKELTPEKQNQYLDIIAEEALRLSDLSGTVMFLSELENQQMIPDRHYFALDEQIKECVILLAPEWTGKNIEMDADLDPLSYRGNPYLMKQIWINLIGNVSSMGGFLPAPGQSVLKDLQGGRQNRHGRPEVGAFPDPRRCFPYPSRRHRNGYQEKFRPQGGGKPGGSEKNAGIQLTRPAEAARIIIGGLERGKARILFGGHGLKAVPVSAAREYIAVSWPGQPRIL